MKIDMPLHHEKKKIEPQTNFRAAYGEGGVAFAAPSLVCRGSLHDYRITNKKT